MQIPGCGHADLEEGEGSCGDEEYAAHDQRRVHVQVLRRVQGTDVRVDVQI